MSEIARKCEEMHTFSHRFHTDSSAQPLPTDENYVSSLLQFELEFVFRYDSNKHAKSR